MGREVRMEFRTLRADEIDARVSQVSEKGIVLLLYKDSRCDMRLLDETVGSMNWQRDHKELKGNMYCGVGIWDDEKKTWIWKWDCGTESYTEAQKGEASDSFKRACFNWGAGRELYTAPFIWIGKDLCKIVTGKNGKPACYDRFKVKEINYSGNAISGVTIINERNHKVVFQWGDTLKDTGWHRDIKAEESTDDADSLKKAKHEFVQRCNENGQNAVKIMEKAGWSIDKGDATLDDYAKANIILDERLGVQS